MLVKLTRKKIIYSSVTSCLRDKSVLFKQSFSFQSSLGHSSVCETTHCIVASLSLRPFFASEPETLISVSIGLTHVSQVSLLAQSKYHSKPAWG